ncbi:predicted protein [Plenodomus lingam JN3]|uniref:Predicted protein n=1 Tax=Leptosphaeria maculans (strain JN3 / isolate v23.1.3 / race Av1-4-5-6-7-8) TaxID=985895 RepID=E5AF02_LEPMJ|nr:predicted protein [Plenodomus lingam JN3]CBY01791.1 predicted protein [Plenodomus lingam JN3]
MYRCSDKGSLCTLHEVCSHARCRIPTLIYTHSHSRETKTGDELWDDISPICITVHGVHGYCTWHAVRHRDHCSRAAPGASRCRP